MKLWHIKENNRELEIDVGSITILRGSHSTWYKLIRSIEDYFINRNSEVSILEDTQLLHKKDWECLFIPFDASLDLNKITTKSPLKHLLDEVSNEIALTPIFSELITIWDEMNEELEFVKRKFEKYDIDINLKEFDIDDLKSFIEFKTKQMLTPIEYKKLLLTLFTDKYPEKKRLVIIELPELYAEETRLLELISDIVSLSNKGTSFIIVTTSDLFNGNANYIFSDHVLNDAKVMLVKRKVINELPFYCDNDLFERAKSKLLDYVDNSIKSNEKTPLSTDQDEMLITTIFLLAYHLNIKVNLDISVLSQNMKAFSNSYN